MWPSAGLRGRRTCGHQEAPLRHNDGCQIKTCGLQLITFLILPLSHWYLFESFESASNLRVYSLLSVSDGLNRQADPVMESSCWSRSATLCQTSTHVRYIMGSLQLYGASNLLTHGELIQFAPLYWFVQYCWSVKNEATSNGFYMNITALSLIPNPALEDYTISLWWWDHCCGRQFNSTGRGWIK